MTLYDKQKAQLQLGDQDVQPKVNSTSTRLPLSTSISVSASIPAPIEKSGPASISVLESFSTSASISAPTSKRPLIPQLSTESSSTSGGLWMGNVGNSVGSKSPFGGAGCSSNSQPSYKCKEKDPGASTVSRSVPGRPISVFCRPIFPNIPFSPFTSPCSSPFTRRREFRESQRVSIEKDGDHIQLNQYRLKEPIGQGSFGIVKLAYNEQDEKHYAMKMLSKRKLLQKSGVFGRVMPSRRVGKFTALNPLAKIYTEVAILRKLTHPNIVNLVEVLDDPTEDNLYLVFELLERGEILQIPTTSPLSEEKTWKYFRDVILGIEYLHYQKIIHRDIKPSNLLVSDDDHIKIADFGVCNEFNGQDDALLTNTSGTPAFIPPEALKTLNESYSGKAADVWQLGVTLYALVFGFVPFHDTSIVTLYYKIQHEPLKFPKQSTITSQLQELIVGMLQKDPTERITIPEIKNHDWVTQNMEHPLPSEEENCKSYVEVTDEEIINSVRSIPKLDTLIMVKKMIKNHSFQHPFRKYGHGFKVKNLLHLNGRSHSAPSSYDFFLDRKRSMDCILPILRETPRDSSYSGSRHLTHDGSEQSQDGGDP